MRRLLLKLVTNPSRRSTVPSNVNLVFRQPDFATKRNWAAVSPSATHLRQVAAARNVNCWQIADSTPKLVSDKAVLRLLLSCSRFSTLDCVLKAPTQILPWESLTGSHANWTSVEGALREFPCRASVAHAKGTKRARLRVHSPSDLRPREELFSSPRGRRSSRPNTAREVGGPHRRLSGNQ